MVDETYAVFAGENAVDLVARHPNLCVVRTFSKSHCLAGMRVGYALAQPGVIGLLDRVKDSYNVSRLSQAAALAALADPDYYAGLVRKIRATRDRARQAWTDRFGWFTYPSQTNFLFTEPRDRAGRTGPEVARGLYDFLCARKILVRHFGSHALTSLFPPHQRRHRRRNARVAGAPRGMAKIRIATISRSTAETDITLKLTVDGAGVPEVDTGIPFLDHMLTLFAKHGLFDLEVKAKGDVAVDYHHTVEDVGLVLGEAFKTALGDKVGLKRYGFFLLPMDESLARVVLDLGGRPHLVYEVEAPTMFVRDFNLALVKEFFRAFANSVGANVHIQLLYGEEPHHVVEAVFKCFARALDVATQIEPRAADQLPSTKGKL